MKYTFLMVSFFVMVFGINAQQKNNENIVQLSGMVYSKANQTPVSYAYIRIKNSFRSSLANAQGFYTMPVKLNDTVIISSVGYKLFSFVVTDTLTTNSANYNVYLEKDTVTYTTKIPTKEQFKAAFLSLRLDENIYDLARQNLSDEQMSVLFKSLPRDGQEMANMTVHQLANSYYYAGGQMNFMMINGSLVPSSLLSPTAWKQFFDAIKNGDFKKK